LPSDAVGQTKETFEEPQQKETDKNEQHETGAGIAATTIRVFE